MGKLQSSCLTHTKEKPQREDGIVFVVRQEGRRYHNKLGSEISVVPFPSKILGSLHVVLESTGPGERLLLGMDICICLFPFKVPFAFSFTEGSQPL